MVRVLGLFAALVIIVAGAIAIMNNGIHLGKGSSGDTRTNLAAEDVKIQDGVYFEKMSLAGMNREEVEEAIENWISSLDWNMQIHCQDQVVPLEKYLSCPDDLIEEIFSKGSQFKAETLSTDENPRTTTLTFTADRLFDETKAREVLSHLAEQYNTEPKDAALSGLDENGNLIFQDAEDGYVLNTEKTLAVLHDTVAKRNFHNSLGAVYDTVEPTYTLADAKADYQQIGWVRTAVSSYNPSRDANIRVACNTVNGTVVKPGEEFSILGILGDTTSDKGYQAAATYANGQVVDDLGGGICQVSTTLYNAVVKAGLETTERHYHSMAVHYVNLGEDAMISYPNSDLKFVNNSKGDILIQMYYYDSWVYAYLYGIPVLEDGITVAMYSETTEVMECQTQYIEDPSLPPGEQERESGGDDGARVTTYLITYQNGNEINREWLHNSVYQARNPVVRRNTSTPVQTEHEPQSSSQSGEDGSSSAYEDDNTGEDSDYDYSDYDNSGDYDEGDDSDWEDEDEE